MNQISYLKYLVLATGFIFVLGLPSVVFAQDCTIEMDIKNNGDVDYIYKQRGRRMATHKAELDKGRMKMMRKTGTVPEGMCEQDYPQGHAKWKEIEYKNGMRNGMYKEFYDKGYKKIEAEYVDGVMEGVYKDFHENGQVASEYRYVDGKMSGEYKAYFDTGEVQEEGRYIDDRPVGEFKTYLEDGRVESIKKYTDQGTLLNEQFLATDDEDEDDEFSFARNRHMPIEPFKRKVTIAAVNSNKAIYRPGENVKLDMAVLDQEGEMICDADLKLNVLNESKELVASLSSYKRTIKVNKEVCKKKEYTLVPDYFGTTLAKEPGLYTLELTAKYNATEKTISNKFIVTDYSKYDVERTSITRAYPPLNYPMKIKVKAREDFKGKFEELIPKQIELRDKNPLYEIESSGIFNRLIWDVDWKEGEEYELAYHYRIPQHSPDFYQLKGGAIIEDGTNKVVMAEQSQWQIAADPRLDFGTAEEFDSNGVANIQSVRIDEDKFVICYIDNPAGECIVATVSGTDMTFGTSSQFDADIQVGTAAHVQIGVARLDTDKFAVSYPDDGSGDDGFTRAASVSGTTITYGSAVEFETGDTEWQGAAGIDTDRWVIGYNDEGNSNTGKAIVCNAAVLVTTCGTAVDYEAADNFPKYNSPSRIGDNRYIIPYEREDATHAAKVVAGTVTAPTTISHGTNVTMNNPSATAYFRSCAPELQEGRFIAAFVNLDSNDSTEVYPGTVAGNVITLGSRVDPNITDSEGTWPACAFINEYDFAIRYEDIDQSQNGVVTTCHVDWSTPSAVCNGFGQTFAAVQIGSDEPSNNNNREGGTIATITNYNSTSAPAKVVIGYVDDQGNADTALDNDGQAIIANVTPYLGSAMVD